MTETVPTTFLTLPPEIRNVIYHFVYPPPSTHHSQRLKTHTPAPTCSLSTFGRPSSLDSLPPPSNPSNRAALVRTCKQLNAETQSLYLTQTHFHLPGPSAAPEHFNHMSAPLSPAHLSQIRHVVLAGRINHFRALNESWDHVPFANPHLHLATLTLIPRRPQTHETQYAEIADSNQSHTLAYILAETLKGLKAVDRIVVRNHDQCFNDVVWRHVYRTLVYRLWRWGGGNLDLMFRQDEAEKYWFEILVGGEKEDGQVWKSAGEEVERLVGSDKPQSVTTAVAGSGTPA